MRALDRLISFVFSVIMLMVSVVLILVGVGVVEPQMLIDMLNEHVFVKDVIASNTFNAVTITGIVLLLASLKTTIFLSLFKVKDKAPILVKTPNGEVEIAQETIISTVKNVAVSFENIKDVQATMQKRKKGVVIYAMVLVYANTNIRETIEEMQKQVKEMVKNTTGVDVIEVNIKVKNIYSKQKKNDDRKIEPQKVSEEVQISNKVEKETLPAEEISESTKNEEVMLEEDLSLEETQEDGLDQISIDTEENNK